MNNNLSGIPGKAALRDFNANAFNSSPIKRNESNNRFLQEPSSLDLFQLVGRTIQIWLFKMNIIYLGNDFETHNLQNNSCL